MTDYETVAVIIFKVKNNQPYFYLVKRGSELPVYPDTWTPIAGAIQDKDEEVFSILYDKLGNVIDDMKPKLTAIRLLVERNLLSTSIDEPLVQSDTDPHELLENIDPDLLNLYLHSMVPVGTHVIDDGLNKFTVRNYIFLTTDRRVFPRTKIVKQSHVYENLKAKNEVTSKWLSSFRIKKLHTKLHQLFEPVFAEVIQLITTKEMRLIEAARTVEKSLQHNVPLLNQLLPYIWRFLTPALTLPPFHTTNIYVIGNNSKYIIDPGANNASDLKSLRQFIESSLEQIEGIILTSANADHCNQVLDLKKRYNFPIFASQYVAEMMKQENCIVNKILQEGDRIQLGQYQPLNDKEWYLEVVDLPGNSPGCIGLWDSRGIMFTGSTLHKTLTSTPGPFKNSYRDLQQSIKKLKKYKIKFGLSGHGSIITNIRSVIKLNLQRLNWVEETILSHLKEGYSLIDDVTEQLADANAPNGKRITRTTIEANLEKLVFEGKVIQRGDDFLIANIN